MFWHMLKYRLKISFRTKECSFWNLIFPLILCTCFFLAFSDINSKSEGFHTIPVAIVLEDGETDTNFTQLMDNLKTDEEMNFFKVTYTTLDDATTLLKNEDVQGIVEMKDHTPSLTVLENSIESSIIKCVLDRYIQTVDLYTKAASDPIKFAKLMESTSTDVISITTHSYGDGNLDNVIDYFYSLIAMTCLFASFSGHLAACQMKATHSPEGMRKNLGRNHRMVMIFADMAGSFLIHALSNAILLCYMLYILKLNLGAGFLPLFGISLIGSLIGLNIGILVGSLPGVTLEKGMGLNTVISLTLSFFSGLMVGGIRQSIEATAPLFNRLNPATLICNSIYALNIYDNYDKFFMNLIIMIVMSVVLCILSYLLTRRETYDSL